MYSIESIFCLCSLCYLKISEEMELCIVEICSYGRCPKVADLNVLCTDILGRDGGSIVIVLNALLYNERRKLTLIIGYLLVNCIFSREKHCLRGEMLFSKIPL